MEMDLKFLLRVADLGEGVLSDTQWNNEAALIVSGLYSPT
jgi:hypothetical protein